jgi:Protein of unknown function (DUF2911)
MKRLVTLAAAVALSTAALAQDNPRGTATTTVGGKKVTVSYGRPVLKGRKMDDLLKQLPADRMWRAGENQVTTLTTEGALTIGSKTVPPGTYSLYVNAPATGEWSLVLNTDKGVPLGQIWDKAPANLKNEPWPHIEDYTKSIASSETLRVPMKSGATSPPDESFTISFAPAGEGAVMTLAWADKSWSTELKPAK